MAGGYPKRFHLTGLIELSYRDYSIDITAGNRKFKSGFSTFEQLYQVGLEGYIYHPRLLVFSTKLDYDYTMYKNGFSTNLKNIGYEIDIRFFPYRPFSLYAYAQRSDYTVSSTFAPLEGTTNQYAAGLRLSNVWKLPDINADYWHFDIGSSVSSTKTKTDTWEIRMGGGLKPINTKYAVSFGLSDTSSSLLSYTSRYATGSTATNIANIQLLTYLRTLDQDFLKETEYSVYLLPKPGKRFYQEYRYENYDYEFNFKDIETGVQEQITKTSDRVFTGKWSYRFTERLYGSMSLNYGLHREGAGITEITNANKWTYYGFIPSLDYRRPIAGFDFSSHYVYFFRKDEQRGELKEHDLELGLETRRFKLGTIYVDYDYLKSNAIDKLFATEEDILTPGAGFKISTVNTTSYLFRTGIRGRLGRGAGRAYWNIEGQYLHSTANGKRPITTLERELIVEFSRKTSQYTVYGEMSYPLGRGATVNLRAGYSTGTTDSKSVSRFYYDERFTYPLTRRLSFSAWWMQIWDKFEGGADRKIRDYDVLITYALGQVFFSLEYEGLRDEENSVTTDTKRVFLRLRRPFY